MTTDIIADERGRWIRLSGRWGEGDGAAIHAADADWLVIRGFAGQDLDFLIELREVGLKQLDILGPSIADVSGVKHLPTLRRLNIGTRFRRRIDISPLSNITELHLEWGPGAETLVACASLRSLSLQRPSMKEPSLLGQLVCLEALRLADSRELTSLSGLERLSRLRSIRLLELNALGDIEALGETPALVDVTLDGCARLESLAPLASRGNLRRLALVDCGQIDSLEPLKGLTGLEELLISGTRIGDQGAPDLSQMRGLRKLILRGTGLPPTLAKTLEWEIAQRSVA